MSLPCSGGPACAPASEGPSGATVEAAGGSPQIRQGGRSAAQSARTRAGLRKRRPRSPRSPALGRTHNDGAPVLKLGQGLISEIATFTIESGPTTPRCLARFVDAVSRDGAPGTTRTHMSRTQIDVWQYPGRRAAEIRYAHCGKTASSEAVRPWSCDCSLTLWNAVGGVTAPPTA